MLTRRPFCFSFAFVFLIFLLPDCFSQISLAQAPHPRERLHGVLSRARLSPELRGNTVIRFSPDGQFLFVQDSAGLMLLSRNPLQLISYIDAPYSYPARFSADSKSVILVSYDLQYSRWNLPDGKRIGSSLLIIPGGCVAASLSPAGDLLGCYTPEWDLTLYRLENSRKLFSANMQSRPSGRGFFSIPFDSNSNYSSPFGYFLANDSKNLADRGLFRFPIWFSPDGKVLIAGDDSNSVRVNLSSFTKEDFSSSVRKHMTSVAGIADSDRVLLADSSKSNPPYVASLSTGQTLANISVSAETAMLCTASRYAVFRKEGESGIQLVDLSSNAALPFTESISLDVFANEIVTLRRDDVLAFYKIGESKPQLAVRLPLGPLPPLRASAVDSSLTVLALSVDGSGSVFDVASGKPFLQRKFFVGAQIADPKRPLLLLPRKWKEPHSVVRADAEAQSTSSAWAAAASSTELHMGEAAVVEYSFDTDVRHLRYFDPNPSGVPFILRGLDPATGTQLWHFSFTEEIPVPFRDPQGVRFVLGWKAKTEHAWNAVKGNPVSREAYKSSKRMQQDTVFEVLDSLTRKSLGGVFVQFGDGPSNFTSAFSVGDSLFLIKDNMRVFLLSLRDGKLVASLKGFQPTANGLANLFAMNEGSGRLGVYDLQTGAKLEQQLFPDEVSYTHFSADGKKLLVLTQHQEVFVLDMSDVREHPLPPAHETPASSNTATDQPR
jgi:WD40 repeat protein